MTPDLMKRGAERVQHHAERVASATASGCTLCSAAIRASRGCKRSAASPFPNSRPPANGDHAMGRMRCC